MTSNKLPLFRLNITATQTGLLLQLLDRSAVSAAQASELGALYAQVQAGKKYFNLPDPPPAPPNVAG
jgi:hypothetical protein